MKTLKTLLIYVLSLASLLGQESVLFIKESQLEKTETRSGSYIYKPKLFKDRDVVLQLRGRERFKDVIRFSPSTNAVMLYKGLLRTSDFDVELPPSTQTVITIFPRKGQNRHATYRIYLQE